MGRKPKSVSAIGERILSRLEAGETREAFARRIGVSDRSLGNYIRGDRRPSPDFLGRLHDGTGADINWILKGGTELPFEQRGQEADFGRAVEAFGRAARDDVLGANDSGVGQPGWLAADVPVHGTVAGSVLGQVAVSIDPVSRIARPPGIRPAERVYALFVRGVSMAPRYRDGDVVFVAPDRPCRSGDIVVVMTRNHSGADMLGTIKELVRDSAREILTRQYNPKSEMTIRRPTIVAIHRVLTLNDLLGL